MGKEIRKRKHPLHIDDHYTRLLVSFLVIIRLERLVALERTPLSLSERSR